MSRPAKGSAKLVPKPVRLDEAGHALVAKAAKLKPSGSVVSRKARRELMPGVPATDPGGFSFGVNMNDLTTVSGAMDSREIAALTGKNHSDVCRDIRSMLEALEADESNFASVYRGGNGEDRRCYVLPKRECLILASGYSVKLRAAIIDRWAELEAANAPKLPATYSEALRLAADQAERLEAQALQLEHQAPAVAFVDRYVEAKATQPIRAVAKILGRIANRVQSGRWPI